MFFKPSRGSNLPCRNQTWQWNIAHLLFIYGYLWIFMDIYGCSAFPVKTYMNWRFPLASFDCQRVCRGIPPQNAEWTIDPCHRRLGHRYIGALYHGALGVGPPPSAFQSTKQCKKKETGDSWEVEVGLIEVTLPSGSKWRPCGHNRLVWHVIMTYHDQLRSGSDS